MLMKGEIADHDSENIKIRLSTVAYPSVTQQSLSSKLIVVCHMLNSDSLKWLIFAYPQSLTLLVGMILLTNSYDLW